MINIHRLRTVANLDRNCALVWPFGPLAKEKSVNVDDYFPKIGPRNAWHP